MKILVLLLTLMASLWAAPTGELSFYIMKNGTPLANQSVIIYKKTPQASMNMPSSYDRHAEFITDEDGYITSILPVGIYQLQLLAIENGVPLVFAKKPFTIKENKESQIILALKDDNSVDFDDIEAPKNTEIVVKEDQNTSKVIGSIVLNLHSSEDTKNISQARVFVQGFNFDLTSDENGNVKIDLPEGVHTISIIHSHYSAQTIKVTVVGNEFVNKSIELSPASMELEEFVVLAPQVQGSVASVIAEEKNSESIASIIGSEQMSKSGDSNAASALKRVAGVSIIGGKSVYVRGLGDRYSATEMNNMSLPSPNPLQRTIPLDLFPSAVIGSLEVQKTFSPDITGAFGGGYINVRTKKAVEEDYVKLKVGVNAHDSIGQDAPSYQGGDSDLSGYDDSYRPFPNSFVDASTAKVGGLVPDSGDVTDQEYQNMLTQRSLNNQTTIVPLGSEYEFEVGKNFTFSDDHQLNFIATYGYKSSAKVQDFSSVEYDISDGVQDDDPYNESDSRHYTENIQHGGIFNASYIFRNFDISYTLLYVLNTTDKTRSSQGTYGENQIDQRKSLFEWQERDLLVNQVTGGLDYDLSFKNRFDFGVEVARAKEYVPNDVSYNYTNEFGTGYEFSNQSQLLYESRETIDDVSNLFLKNRSFIPVFTEDDYIEIGGVVEKKERTYRYVALQVQDPTGSLPSDVASSSIDDILSYGDGSDLSYNYYSTPSDNYDANMQREAVYFKGLLKPIDGLELSFGVRHVGIEQNIDQFTTGAGNIIETERTTLEFTKNLPSISAKVVLNEQNQIRFAYSETFIYPDFREVSPAEFTHPVFDAQVLGNPDLIETDISSYDARYEFYFNTTDVMSFAVFYKQLDNPIEDTIVETTGGGLTFSYDNALAADIAGLELSVNKSLGFIDSHFENFSISGNYTYLESSVTLSAEQEARYVTDERTLQGLSPHVINLALNYSDIGTRSLNLSYNKMSERLMRVGTENPLTTSVRNVYGLDQYEIPPALLDFTWIENFHSDMFETDYAVTFKAKNLLDQETIWIEGEQTILTFKTGRSFSASVSAKF